MSQKISLLQLDPILFTVKVNPNFMELIKKLGGKVTIYDIIHETGKARQSISLQLNKLVSKGLLKKDIAVRPHIFELKHLQSQSKN